MYFIFTFTNRIIRPVASTTLHIYTPHLDIEVTCNRVRQPLEFYSAFNMQ